MRAQGTIKRVHFIGIGGAGVSGVALVAHKRGIRVSGSDLKESRYMRALLREGVLVTVGHSADNVQDRSIDVVVVSSAIPENNPELAAARELGLTIWPRARMLAYLGRGYRTLAVGGTHGKTTTSSLLATSLVRLKADPTFLIGGVVDGFDSTAYAGKGEYFVVEADESDGSFTELDPALAIITNVEADHLDHYDDLEQIRGSFADFLGKLRPDGVAVVCADCPGLPELAAGSGRRVCTYGLAAGADVVCKPRTVDSFDVVFADGQALTLTLGAVPGQHNMLNATAVMAALDHLGFERRAAAGAVSGFSGVRRRFDRIGEAAGVVVVDDYGHHPTEVAATLKAASELGYRQVHLLFQPHRYTRTEAFLEQFARSFAAADTVTLMDIYSTGEAPIPGVNSQTLAQVAQELDPSARVRYIARRSEVAAAMAAAASTGDLIITMGAGDITQMAPLILEELAQSGGGR